MFIHEDFLLHTEFARRLYRDYAANEPILDYHCHLPPEDVAANRRFRNLTEIWLEGDHYKWRAMRANGVAEELITGDADPYDKFLAWARTVPHTLRNPLYHWTHLELKRYFGIDELLSEDTAEPIWKRANDMLAGDELSARGILTRFDVRAVCTTDDPADPLTYHEALAASDLTCRVLPTFRPDKCLQVGQPAAWNEWIDRLAATSGCEIETLDQLLQALRHRHDDFHALGGRLSDHGLETCCGRTCDAATAAAIFTQVRSNQPADALHTELFQSFMMLYFARLDAERDWTKQLHLGALRNNNKFRLAELGPDTGYDSIGDFPQARALSAMLGQMEEAAALPQMIVYNINPADNYVVATMLGNFQGDGHVGKMQFGSGWWFLDQKEGMEWQINALSNLGLLSRFVGMLTDSRSFMSYPRHEYFRRVLCNLLGRDMDLGELPRDLTLVGEMTRRICYQNARDYLRLDIE